jgi:hypothetical protein
MVRLKTAELRRGIGGGKGEGKARGRGGKVAFAHTSKKHYIVADRRRVCRGDGPRDEKMLFLTNPRIRAFQAEWRVWHF